MLPDSPPGALPYAGIRVVEFTHMVMGPTCGMVLADLGAQVAEHQAAGRAHHHVRELDDAQAGVGKRGRCADGHPAILREPGWKKPGRPGFVHAATGETVIRP